jgi:2-oxoglutarate dehydrogenase E2 component (dihydrolipoamide succinyltransferase)
MATNVPIPNLSESISEVILLQWLKNEGEYVKQDEPLAELETDKANTVLPAPLSGVLHQVRKAGETLKVGELAATIDEAATATAGAKPAIAPPVATPSAGAAASAPAASAAGKTAPPVAASTAPNSSAAAGPRPAAAEAAAPVSPSTPPEPASAGLDDVNPSVRPLLIEHKLNPKEIPATGPHGRLLKEDVLRFLEQNNGKPVAAAAIAPPPAAPIPVSPPPALSTPPAARPSAPAGPRQFDANGVSREPMSKIRKRTAINLKEAQNTAAILTTFNEVDMSAIMEMRARLKERFEKTHGIGLGFMSFFSRAVILGLREFPKINAYIEGDDIVYHNYVNLGIAVSSERGLSVPVLKNAERMSFAKIESEIKRVATAVKEGKLTLQELSGGTFTITNGGVFHSLLSTPILNPPQSGILGMHDIKKRPVAIDDKVEIRPMMYIALSYDHRIVDGRDSVSFLVRVKEYLEDPARLMLEV